MIKTFCAVVNSMLAKNNLKQEWNHENENMAFSVWFILVYSVISFYSSNSE